MHLRTKCGTLISSGLLTKTLPLSNKHQPGTIYHTTSLLQTRPFCCTKWAHIYIDLLYRHSKSLFFTRGCPLHNVPHDFRHPSFLSYGFLRKRCCYLAAVICRDAVGVTRRPSKLWFPKESSAIIQRPWFQFKLWFRMDTVTYCGGEWMIQTQHYQYIWKMRSHRKIKTIGE